jgi:VIT1/CCC1 family predicted Fe2+/Mn2+ transporter
MRHREQHRSSRIGWLRAAVLGANDGIVSTASLIVGHELAAQPGAEEDELTTIYVGRGLEPGLARQVARQLTARDALVAHPRDELGLTEEQAARPLQAAFASAGTFAAGAAVPIVATIVVTPSATSCQGSRWRAC